MTLIFFLGAPPDTHAMPRCVGWLTEAFWKQATEADVKRCVAQGTRAGMQRKKDGMTPLHLAAGVGSAETVKALIAAGADVGAQDHRSLTPLHLAAMQGETRVLKTLIEAGALIEAQNEKRLTPLHMAAFQGETEAVKALIAAGAVIDAHNSDTWTPLHYGAVRGQSDFAPCSRRG